MAGPGNQEHSPTLGCCAIIKEYPAGWVGGWVGGFAGVRACGQVGALVVVMVGGGCGVRSGGSRTISNATRSSSSIRINSRTIQHQPLPRRQRCHEYHRQRIKSSTGGARRSRIMTSASTVAATPTTTQRCAAAVATATATYVSSAPTNKLRLIASYSSSARCSSRACTASPRQLVMCVGGCGRCFGLAMWSCARASRRQGLVCGQDLGASPGT